MRFYVPAGGVLIAAMGAGFDGMIAGFCPRPGLMVKLRKCHELRDREVLDDPSNTKESFPSCRYGHPWLFAIGATPVQRMIIKRALFVIVVSYGLPQSGQ